MVDRASYQNRKQMFMALVREMAAKYDENFPDIKLGLAFVKYKYVMSAYMATLKDVDLEKLFFKWPIKYERGSHRVFAADRFGLLYERWNSFLLEYGDLRRATGYGFENYHYYME